MAKIHYVVVLAHHKNYVCMCIYTTKEVVISKDGVFINIPSKSVQHGDVSIHIKNVV